MILGLSGGFMKTFLFCLFFSAQLMAAESITGYWKAFESLDDKPRSIIGIYENDGKFYGRILLRYNPDGSITDTLETPEKKTEGVAGNPFYAGLDVLYDLLQVDEKFNGKVIDPEKGRIYDAILWREGENLIMRGEMKLLGHAIGRNNTWLPATDADFPKDFAKPPLNTFTPKVPEPLRKP
jgi:uncharacterized protein (DUF2147 family)